MKNSASWKRRLIGTVIERPLDYRPAGPPEFVEQVISYSRYEWQPPYQLSGPNLSQFKLALDCYIGPDRIRRLTKVAPSESDFRADPLLERIVTVRKLAYMASFGGSLLMHDRGAFEPDVLVTPEHARFFLQYMEHRHKFLHPRKDIQENLGVAAAGRPYRGKMTILPDDLEDPDAFGTDRRGSSETLAKNGVAEAHAAGIKSATPRQVLSYGLLAAAKKRPLNLIALSDIESVVRMSLFASTESGSKVTQKQLQDVAARVRKSLEQRWMSDKKLDDWIKDRKADFVHSISKSCSLSREHAKKVLLELGWRSLKVVGRCIDVQMRAFRDALAVPLTPDEDRLFSQTFLANPTFAGLPLLLLRAQYGDLSAAITEVWNNPDDKEAKAALHQVMQYYAELQTNRRAADTRYKHHSSKTSNRAKSGRLSTEVAYQIEPEKALTGDEWDEVRVQSKAAQTKRTPKFDEAVPTESRELIVFRETAKRLAESRGHDCEFADHDWWATLDFPGPPDIRFELCCPAIDFDEVITVPRAEFEAIAKEVQNVE